MVFSARHVDVTSADINPILLGDTSYFGPEPEFFIFNGVRYDSNQHSSYFYIESEEGFWNAG